MYARVATFESDASKVDDAIATVRSAVEGETPPGLEGAKMLMLVDRKRARGSGSRCSRARKRCGGVTRRSTR